MADYGHPEREEFRGAQIQILSTNPDSPEEGRIFVWTKMGWFERLEGESGNIAFTPVADSEEELREFISRDNPKANLQELVGNAKRQFSEEFIEQSRSYVESPDDSKEEPADDDQESHQHD